MTRALPSLVGTLTAIPDSARYLIPCPGDTELPATVIRDREWLAEQIRLRGEIWGIDDPTDPRDLVVVFGKHVPDDASSSRSVPRRRRTRRGFALS
jgi:hypothetical protein